ncbi:MAG: hypothetical protein R2725_09690 [Solirubrobacterales bacterium]
MGVAVAVGVDPLDVDDATGGAAAAGGAGWTTRPGDGLVPRPGSAPLRPAPGIAAG